VLLARVLGVHSYGLYSMGFTLAKIGEALAIFGLRLSVLRFIPLFSSEKRDDLVLGTVYAALLLPICLGLCLSALMWIFAPSIANKVFTEPEAIEPIGVLGLAITFLALSEVSGVLCRALNKPSHYVWIRNVVPQVVFFVLLVPRAFGVPGIHRPWAPIAFDIAFLVAACVGIRLLFKLIRPIRQRTAPTMPFKTLYGYSAAILLNILFYLMLGWTDILVLSIYDTTENVGIYRASFQAIIIFDLIWNGFAAANAHAFPVLIRDKNFAALRHAYDTTVRWVTVLASPIFILMVFHAADFLAILGPGFVAGAASLIILATAALMRVSCATAALLLAISGKQKVENLNGAVAAAVNLVLCLILVPRFGLEGAAAATFLSTFGISVARAIEARLILQVHTIQWRPIIVLLMMAGVGWLFAVGQSPVNLRADTYLWDAAARVALTGGACVLILWLFGLNAEDKRVVGYLVMKRLGRPQSTAPLPRGAIDRTASPTLAVLTSPARPAIRRPDFFIVGAPRCGTSALAVYLGRHPDIFMPVLKDAHFFGHDLHKQPMEFHALDPKKYEQMFAGAGNRRRAGEASVLYLLSRYAGDEIKEYSPDAQIIIMLRNPVDLIASLHGDLVWNTWENFTNIEDALAAEPQRRCGQNIPGNTMIHEALYYREIVKFSEQVERYFTIFGRDLVKVIIYDDFAAQPGAVVADTVDFLKLPYRDIGPFTAINASKVARIRSLQKYIQRPPWPIAPLLHTLPDRVRLPLLRAALSLNSQTVRRPPMDPALRAQLRQEFAPEVEKLSALIGRDLTGWSRG